MVFKNSEIFCFEGRLESVEVGLFKPFTNTRKIYFKLNRIADLLKRPLDWINSINYDIKINDDWDSLDGFLQYNSSLVKFIGFYFEDYSLSDEDLCLFKNFLTVKL